MKNFKRILCVILSLTMVFGLVSSMSYAADFKKEPVKASLSFATMSDPHYYPYSLTGDNCEAFREHCTLNTKLYLQSEAIIRTCLDTILIRNPGIKYILIPGDLTKDSEYEAHVGLAELLREYEEAHGVEFLVTTGNHDINSVKAMTFVNGAEESGRPATAEDFREIYADFGYDLAFAEYAKKGDNVQGQLSYAADLDEAYRLIVIDSAVYSFDPDSPEYYTEGTVTEELMQWVKGLAEDAIKNGKTPMVMMHHGLAAHMETAPSITQEFPLNDYMDVAERFASWGIHYAFTGHLHTNDIASVINDDGDVLYDCETSSVTGFPCTYREMTIQTYEDGESEMSFESVDFDAEKQFTFDGITYENGAYKKEAFALCFGGLTNDDGKASATDFLVNVLKSYTAKIFSEIQETGSISEYLKTLDIDLKAILADFLKPYIGNGIKLGGFNIFSVDNIMWFVDDLLGQIYDLYVKDPTKLYDMLEGIIADFTSMQISDLPCTAFIDTVGFGNADKPGTVNDLILSVLAYWYMGNENAEDDEFVQSVIEGLQSGKTAEKLFDKLIDLLLHNLVEDSILAKLDIRIDKLMNDDVIGKRLGEGINYLLSYVLKGNFSYMNLVDIVFGLGILPYSSLYDLLDQLLLQDYLTFSQFEGTGSFMAFVISDFTTDDNPERLGDEDVIYSTEKVEVPVTRENYRLPSMVSVTLGEDAQTSANISWYSKSTVKGDIEIFDSEGKNDITADLKTEEVTRSYPGLDLGIFGILDYKFRLNRHTVTLSDLEPGETYYYRVGDSEKGWWSETGTITTADGSKNTTILHLTDPQSQTEGQYERAWANVLKNAFSLYPEADFIINTGDLVDHGNNQKQWAWMFNTGSDYLMNTYMMPTSGNHEGMGENAIVNNFLLPGVPEQDTTSGVYYSYDYNNVHVAVLNSEDLGADEGLSAKQIEWLKKDMAESDAQWKFVTIHKAAYSQGSHYKDDDVCAIRQQLQSLMPELDVDMVFQGHDHVYMRTGSLVNNALTDYEKTYLNYKGNIYKTQVLPEGTTYVISGTSGVKTYITKGTAETNKYFPKGEKLLSVSSPMFSAVEIVDGILYFTAYTVDENGAVAVDRFAIQKDKTQGTVEEDYTEPEDTTSTEAVEGILAKIIKIIFKILEVALNFFDIYIADLI